MCAALLSKVSPTEWLGRLWINLLKLRWWVAGLFWKGRICFPGPIYCDRTWDLFLGVHIMHLHQTFLYLLEPPEVMLCIRCSLVLYNLRDNVKVRFNFDVTNIKSHSHKRRFRFRFRFRVCGEGRNTSSPKNAWEAFSNGNRFALSRAQHGWNNWVTSKLETFWGNTVELRDYLRFLCHRC